MWNQSDTGGGFMAGASPGQKDKKKVRNQNLVPVTIAQIIKSELDDDRLRIGDIEVNMISIVAQVLSVEQQTTHILYEITDHTGKIKLQQWLDEDLEDDARKPMVENTYVRVVGTVKSMQGKRHVIVFKINTVTDLNELTCHILEVAHSRKMANTVLKEGGAGGGMVQPGGSDFSVDMGGGGGGVAGLNRTQAAVYRVIQSSTTAEGLSVDSIMKQVSQFSSAEVNKAINFLSDEGHVYSTIDELHYKATDSMYN